MGLLNYTTSIAVEKTIGEIYGLLRRSGARQIREDNDPEGNTTAIAFVIETRFGFRSFRLPADVERAYHVLVRQADQRQIPRRYATREQAARVAWRIVYDWLRAQLAIIETEMVSLEQVLLPHMQDDDGRTVYEVMIEHQMRLPAGNTVMALPEPRG